MKKQLRLEKELDKLNVILHSIELDNRQLHILSSVILDKQIEYKDRYNHFYHPKEYTPKDI